MEKTTTLDRIAVYQIEIQGALTADEIEPMSPLQINGVQTGPASSTFTVAADQSGLIGLIRQLHGRGLVLLCICRER